MEIFGWIQIREKHMLFTFGNAVSLECPSGGSIHRPNGIAGHPVELGQGK